MTLERNSEILTTLGRQLADHGNIDLQQCLRKAAFENGWFTEENILFALDSWHQALSEENVAQWFQREGLQYRNSGKTVGVIMAGNIPLVGLHDVLTVLITGNKAKIKLSSNDKVLMEFVLQQVVKIAPEWAEKIEVAERLHETDAVIATGSNNTARYFEYYFGKNPHIIRKNRNSVAVLTGEESPEDILRLGSDIFRYYGLGCRNITKLYVPENYDLATFYDGIASFSEVLNNHKYANNYIYHKAIFLMNLHPHLDNDFLLVNENKSIYSPIGTLNYERYPDLSELQQSLDTEKEQIQVIVGNTGKINEEVSFGQSQHPRLWDYADGINTVQFCLGL